MNSPVTSEHSKPLSWLAKRWRALLIACLAVALAAMLWLALPVTASLLLQHLAERANFINPQFSVQRIGLQQSELAHAQFTLDTGIGSVQISLEGVKVDYQLNKLALDSVEIERATLKWHQANAKTAQGSAGPLVMPLNRLSIAQLNVEAETALGRSVFSGKAELNRREDGAMEAVLSDALQALYMTLAPAGDKARIVVKQAGKNVLEAHIYDLNKAPLRAALSAEAKALLEWLSASAWAPERLRAAMTRFSALRESLPATGARVEVKASNSAGGNPATLSGQLIQQGSALLKADIQIPNGGSVVINAQLDAPAPVLFDWTAPLLPANLGEWRLHAGAIEGNAKLFWQTGIWSGSAAIKASGLAMSAGQLNIKNAAAALQIINLYDREAAFNADVPVLQLASGVEANDLTLRANHHPNELALNEARAALFGGSVEVAPTTVDLEQRPISLTLRVQEIDLSRLLQSLNQKDLSGTGAISGELPLLIAGDFLEIRDAKLAATAPGVLRYRGPTPDADNIAFKALTNLSYQALNATLNYQPTGEYHIGLRLEGRNPDLLKGHPLALNLNVTGQLPELLRASLLSGDISRALLEQIQVKESAAEVSSGAGKGSNPPTKNYYNKSPRAVPNHP